jgi:hypothetical protein
MILLNLGKYPGTTSYKILTGIKPGSCPKIMSNCVGLSSQELHRILKIIGRQDLPRNNLTIISLQDLDGLSKDSIRRIRNFFEFLDYFSCPRILLNICKI